MQKKDIQGIRPEINKKEGTPAKESGDLRQRRLSSVPMFPIAIAVFVIMLVAASTMVPKILKSNKLSQVSGNTPALTENISANKLEIGTDMPPVDISPGIMSAITGEFITDDGKRFRFRPDGVFTGYVSSSAPNTVGVYLVNSTQGDMPRQDILTITDGSESASYVLSFSDAGDILLGTGDGNVIFTLKEKKTQPEEPAQENAPETAAEETREETDLEEQETLTETNTDVPDAERLEKGEKNKTENPEDTQEDAALPVGAMPDTSYDAVYGEDIMLAKLIQHESGNQPYAGKVAVAEVVMNRVHENNFPDNVYGVIFQPGQFTNSSELVNSPLTEENLGIARRVMAGIEKVFYNPDVQYFRNPRITSGIPQSLPADWGRFRWYTHIAGHAFYLK